MNNSIRLQFYVQGGKKTQTFELCLAILLFVSWIDNIRAIFLNLASIISSYYELIYSESFYLGHESTQELCDGEI